MTGPMLLLCAALPAVASAFAAAPRQLLRHRTLTAAAATWRPTFDDVERISRGQAAKVKGTGNRGIPHRLNADERQVFERAKMAGYLVVNGRAWRSERAESPLLNTHRNLRDAAGDACVVVYKAADGADTVVCDLSPLRAPAADVAARAAGCLAALGEAAETGRFEPGGAETDGDIDPVQSLPIYRLPEEALGASCASPARACCRRRCRLLRCHCCAATDPRSPAFDPRPRADAKALASALADHFEVRRWAKKATSSAGTSKRTRPRRSDSDH